FPHYHGGVLHHNSLSEDLLKAEGKGVIAAFSPTGFSLDGPAHRFHKVLLNEVMHGEHERLGDAILAGQAGYADTGAFPELLSIYHLLGDPALNLK
ncbi:MAG: C25 family cysteine peptidase, partial [Vicinamibacteria bacterium]